MGEEGVIGMGKIYKEKYPEVQSEPKKPDNQLKQHIENVIEKRKKVLQLEADLKEAKQNRAIADGSLVEYMNELGMDSTKVDGRQIVNYSLSNFTVKKMYRENLYSWLKEHGLSGLIKTTTAVDKSTLSSFFRKEFEKEEHGDMPEWVKEHKEDKISITPKVGI